jgi:hypothetical protein
VITIEASDMWRYLFLFIGVWFALSWGRRARRWGRGRWGAAGGRAESSLDLTAIDGRLAVVDQLESRVAELENRLDFAERLLSERTGAAGEVLRG